MTQEERDERDKKLVAEVLSTGTEEQIKQINEGDYRWLVEQTGLDELRLRTVLYRLDKEIILQGLKDNGILDLDLSCEEMAEKLAEVGIHSQLGRMVSAAYLNKVLWQDMPDYCKKRKWRR